MPDPHARFAADPEVLFTQLGDNEGVLLHLTTQYYYSLNETGLAIWQGITDGMKLEDVANTIREDYEVDEAGARQHVDDFVEHLSKMKLLVEVPDSIDSAG